MRILIVYGWRYPWGIHIRRQIKALKNKGHTVFVLFRGNQNCEYELEDIANGGMFELKIEKFGIPLPFNIIWLYFIYRYVRIYKISLIQVKDIPLGILSVIAGRMLRIPVVLDMAENYPGYFKTIGKHSIFDFLIRWVWITEIIEKLVIRKVRHIIVVIEENRERLISMGVSQEKVTIVKNTVDKEIEPEVEKFKNELDSDLKLIYLGLFDRDRELDVLVKAMDIATRKDKRIKLLMVGDGPTFNEVKNLVQKLELDGNIEFFGRVPLKKIGHYICRADAGIVPHLKGEHTDTTIPNKLFDYMVYEKPVIVSNCVPLKRIVEKEGCGLVYESGNSDELANAVLKIRDKNLRREYGKRGREAVLREYNWNVDGMKYVEALEKTVNE